MTAAAANDPPLPSVGERLRRRRLDLGLTLKDVASGAGLSVGFISQVERGLAAPSLTSLAGMAAVLEVPVGRLLPDLQGAARTRQAQRPVHKVALDADLSYERLTTAFAGSVLNGVIIHENPGHRSEPFRHDGEEMFFVLAGAITVEVDDEPTVLQVGDSLHFSSRRRHSTWNHGTGPATILHVCTMDVFGDRIPPRTAPGHQAGHEGAGSHG